MSETEKKIIDIKGKQREGFIYETIYKIKKWKTSVDLKNPFGGLFNFNINLSLTFY